MIFYDNKFQLNTSDGLFYFSELPADYKTIIRGYYFAYNVVNEDYGNIITDSEKIQWFKFINFAGTPQEYEHLQKTFKIIKYARDSINTGLDV